MRLQTSKGQDSRPVVSFSSQKQASEFSSMLGLPCHRFLFLQYLFLPCEQQVLAPSQHPHPPLSALNSPRRLPGASSVQDRSRAGAASSVLLLLAPGAPAQGPAQHVLLSCLRDGTTGGGGGPPPRDGADVRSS